LGQQQQEEEEALVQQEEDWTRAQLSKVDHCQKSGWWQLGPSHGNSHNVEDVDTQTAVSVCEQIAVGMNGCKQRREKRKESAKHVANH